MMCQFNNIFLWYQPYFIFLVSQMKKTRMRKKESCSRYQSRKWQNFLNPHSIHYLTTGPLVHWFHFFPGSHTLSAFLSLWGSLDSRLCSSNHPLANPHLPSPSLLHQSQPEKIHLWSQPCPLHSCTLVTDGGPEKTLNHTPICEHKPHGDPLPCLATLSHLFSQVFHYSRQPWSQAFSFLKLPTLSLSPSDEEYVSYSTKHNSHKLKTNTPILMTEFTNPSASWFRDSAFLTMYLSGRMVHASVKTNASTGAPVLTSLLL